MKIKSDRLFFFLQACLKNNPFRIAIRLRSFVYKPFFRAFGKNVQIKDGVTFKYPSEIEIGDNCLIGEASYFVGKGGLTIGNDVLVGAGTKIITSKHVATRTDIPMIQQGLDFEPVQIGDDVWFGFDVKVLGGSGVSNHSIVAAGSVVRDSFSDEYLILAGMPATSRRKRTGSPLTVTE